MDTWVVHVSDRHNHDVFECGTYEQAMTLYRRLERDCPQATFGVVALADPDGDRARLWLRPT